MTFNSRTIGYSILALLAALIVSQFFHVGHSHGSEGDQVAQHIHIWLYEHGTKCWCGAYSLISDTIRDLVT